MDIKAGTSSVRQRAPFALQEVKKHSVHMHALDLIELALKGKLKGFEKSDLRD